MVTCSVANCKNSLSRVDYSTQNSKRLSYFSFPKDKRIRQLWIRACQRKDEFNVDYARVCSDHFKREDLARNLETDLLVQVHRRPSLRKEAVPSLKLPPEALRGLDGVGSERAARQAVRERKALVRELLSASPSSLQHQTLSSFVEFCRTKRKPKPPSQVVPDQTRKEQPSRSLFLNNNEYTFYFFSCEDERKVYVRVGPGMTYMLCNVSEIPPTPQLVEVKMEPTDEFYDESLTVEKPTSPFVLKVEVDPADVYCNVPRPEERGTTQVKPDILTGNMPSTSACVTPASPHRIEVKMEPADSYIAENIIDQEEHKIYIKQEAELMIEDEPSTNVYDSEPEQVTCYHCEYTSESLGKLRMHMVRLHLGSIGPKLDASSRWQSSDPRKVSTSTGKMSGTTSESIHNIKQVGGANISILKRFILKQSG